jgi:Uncharacterized protein conserved in bacteria
MKSISILNSWTEIKPKPDNNCWPPARSGHCCVIFQDRFLYVFGGMGKEEALNDMYEYDTFVNVLKSFPSLIFQEWTEIKPTQDLFPSSNI